MDPRLEEISERVLKGEAYGRYNPDAMKARTVDPDNLPDWAKPQEPKPSTWQRAKDFAGDVVENGISAITESKTEDAVNQAKVDYNTYQNQEYAQPVGLSNMLDSARNGVNNLLNARIVDTPSMIGSAMADVGRARAEEYQAAFNDFQNPVKPDGGIPTAAKQILAFPVAYVKATELYNNFNFQWGTPEKNYISEELGRAYGVDSSIFYDDRDAYIRGAQILAGFKALDKRVGDNVDRDDPAAFRAYLKEYYPSIINSSPETFQSKIKNAEDVKQIAELFRTPQLVRDYFYSVSERGNIYKKAYDEKRYLTEEEVARAEELNKRLQEYNKQMPQMHDHPLYGVLAQTGVQVAGMGSDALWGAAAAAVVGGTTQLLTQNPALSKKTASYAFQAGSMYGMFQRQVGEKYVEYLSYQNEDGTRTLTPELAARAAMIETGIETGIEFWNYKSIMRTLSGADRAAIQDIVAKNHGNAEAIRGGLRAYLANAVKAWAPRVKEEVLEEAYQSTTSDLMHNAIVALNPGTKEQYITPGEILGNSAQAMVDAVPSVVGMVAAGDVVSNIRQVRSMAAIYNLHKNLTEEEIQNAELNGILKDVQENQKTSKLAKEDPRAYMQVLKAEADKAGIPNVYVDTEMLMQEPGGREVIEKLGEQSGYTKAQVQETINSKGELEVPTAVYCQVALPSSVGDKVIDMTTASPNVNSQARIKSTIDRITRTAKALAEQDEQEVQEIIPTIVNENFSDEDERKLASEIISGNPNDVQNAYRKALRGAEQEYKNILREVWEREEAASKENHDGTRIAEDKYADDNGNVRVVHNHGTWRDKWWTDYFGIQTPTVEKKEQFAYDIMTGAVAGGPNSLARIRDMAANAGDMDEVGKIDAEMKANKERLDAMANTIATLRGMKDKIAKIQNVETTITRGMTPEAYRVYQRTADLLNHSVGVNKKVQQAARYDGVLFARMCQRLAEEWTRQGKKTTAEDVANTLQIVPAGKAGMQGMNDNSLFKMKPTNAHSLAEFYNAVKENVNSNGKEKTYYRFFTKWGDPIDVAQDDVRHFGRKHAFTGNQFEAIENSLGNVTEYQWDTKKKGHNGGSVCRLKSSSTQGVFGATIEVLPSGRIFLTTAFFDSEKSIDNWLYKEKAPRTTTSHQNGEASSSRMAFNKSILDTIGFVNGGKEKLNQQQAQIQGQTTVTGDMISLFDAADQSTFVHESAHWYLINMQKLALNENASQQFVEDFMTLQQWFGNKKLDADISVEQHEKFARGFEAYLRTGKAPAPQLHGIFNRFKTWLTSIYRDFKQLGGKPTKEVSAVMDRMLATQDEIDMAMKEQMVDDFKRAGGLKTMSGENAHTWERWYNKVRQEAEEKVMGRAMRDLAQADQKDIQEAIDTQRQIALNEMKRDPFWIADEAYRATGDESILATFNLTPQEYADELKKRGGSIEAALDARMEDFEKETRDSAMDIQTITEEAKKAVQTSEYQEMLHALEYEALAQKAKQFIAGEDDKATKAQTKEDKRVAKENAEAEAAAEKDRKISEKLTMREEARNAKVNEAEAEVESIRKGMRIVRDTVLTTLKERREAARIAMAKLPINQATNVSLWARKLGQKQNDVYNYMTRGRWDLAARAKQDQLMMAAMVTEAGKLKVQIDKQAAGIQKRVQTLQKGVERMPSQERYWYQHIAYVLGLSRADGLAPAEGAKQLSDVLMEMAGVDQSGNAEVPVPQWMNSLMNQQVRMGIEKLSPNGWAKVVNVMKALYKMGMDKDKLFVVSAEGVNPTISETAQALAENLLEHNGLHTKADVYSENTFLDKRKANLRDAKEFTGSAFKNLMTPLTILQRMDGYEGKNGRPVAGMAIKTLYDPVERAQNAEIKLLAEFADGLKDAFGTYADEDLDDLHNKRIYRFGNRILTKEEIMCMALTSGTASGYKRVLDNEETGQEFTSLAQRERVLADAVNEAFSNLDERDWTTITKIWNLMGSHYADESGVKERTTGIPLDKLAHRTFSVNGKDGKAYTLQGGYYPVAYDSSKSVKASNLETQDTLKSMAPGALRMGQGKDFTKKREKTVTGRPLLLSFDTISRKGSEMMHYIAYRETALDVSRIINNEAFKHAVTASMGMQEYKILQDWASDIWVPKQEDQALWAKLIRFFRSKTTMAVLGFRTSTMLLNASNAAVMIEHVGPAHFMGYMEKFYSSLAKNTRYVNSLSPFMAERSERMDTNLREAMEKSQMEVKGGFIRNPIWQGAKKLNTAIRENAFKLIGLTDNMFAYPLWYGEYMRTLNEELQAGKTNDEAQKAAVSAGDRAVIRVIGSGEIKDLSPVQKGGEIAKIFTMFYTFANAQWNIMANKHYAGLQAAEKAGRTGLSRYASMEYFIPMAHHFLTMGLMGAAIEMAIRGAMDALSGEDGDKEKDASYWLTKYAETVTGNQAAMVPLVRDVWRPISQSIFYPDDPFSLQKDRAKITSAFDTFVQIANAGVTLRAATMDKKDLSDVVRESGRALNRVTGNPDMITDGLANAIEYYTAPETERDLQMFIGKTLMDRKYPKPAAAKRSTTKKVKATKKNAAKKKAKNKVK